MANIVLSEAERLFLVHGIEQNCRNDGRSCLEYREFSVETDVVSTANGSARVKVEGNTDILVGIKVELDSPNISAPKQGKIDFFIDCSALASPRFEGREGKELQTDIYNVLNSVYCQGSAAVSNLSQLCIVEGRHCWLLNIDIVILECVGGSLYDVISLAVKAALYNTQIPSVEYDAESEEIHVCNDVTQCLENWFDWESCPILITVSKIGNTTSAHVVDTTAQEENCSNARLVFGVNPRGQVSGCRKYGTHSLSFSSLSAMMQTGREVGMHLHNVLLHQLMLDEKGTELNQDVLI